MEELLKNTKGIEEDQCNWSRVKSVVSQALKTFLEYSVTRMNFVLLWYSYIAIMCFSLIRHTLVSTMSIRILTLSLFLLLIVKV